MADVIHGNVELASTKMDLIASIVQKELAFQAKLIPTVTDYSFLVGKGAKSLSLPLATSFTATDRASAVCGDATALTFSAEQMLLNHCAYVSWIVDSCDEIQSTVNVQAELAKRAASAHGRKVDTEIIAELELVGQATTTAGNISKEIVLEMREVLCKRFADMNMLTLLVGCDSEKILLGLADFVRPDAYGSAIVPSGVLGKIYGANVVVHPGLAAGQFFMYEQGAAAIAFQQAPKLANQKEICYGSGAERWVMDALYGIKGLGIAQAGAGAGISALAVKDNN